MSYLKHLESTSDLSTHDADILQTIHDGRPLLARYDLAKAKSELDRDEVARRPAGIWRWRELLPIRDERFRFSLGEVETPLLHCPRLGAALGVEDLWIKDESPLPTGSFKARGMAVAVARAAELGVKTLAVPTQGNAGGALAAYAARAGLKAFVFLPEDAPVVSRYEPGLYGAHTFLVDGLLHECAALVRAGTERFGWFDMSTLREPYRLEGKKTMGLELALQMGFKLPDVILYPTGGGTGLIGMWKGFHELEQLGWLAARKMPRMFACQSSTCAPIPTAFEMGMEHSAPVEVPHTIASGLRVVKAIGDFLILRAVRKSGGQALPADEGRLVEWMRLASASEGIALCPEAATCIGALKLALLEGTIRKDERIVIFNTGTALKYVEVITTDVPRLDKDAVDWSLVESAVRAGSGG